MSGALPFPLFPVPKLVERPWGGTSLRDWGRPCVDGSRIGESWELGQLPGFDSPLEGTGFRHLSQASAHMDGTWLGVKGREFPLLVKLIDARENLSIQIHPAYDGPDGLVKNECWFVLEAPPGAELLAGTTGEPDRERLHAELKAGDTSSLGRVPVTAGDMVMIPTGTAHAITAGLVVLEVQQPSDSTFRLHDWGRVGTDGKPRELHLEQASRHLDPRAGAGLKIAPVPVGPGRELLCATPWFAIARIRPGKGERMEAGGGFRLLFVVEGPVDLEWQGGRKVLEKGRLALLPRGLRYEIAGGLVLEIWEPDWDRDILGPVLASGFTAADAAALSAGTVRR
jgi:mannose-6-phosphate isomerase